MDWSKLGFEVLRPRSCFSRRISFQRFYVPATWKKADAIPIPKITSPEDIIKEFRPFHLITSTLSKTCELFVTDWLLECIKEKIDRRWFFKEHALRQPTKLY